MELTRILDTLKDADGNPALGTLTISNPNFIAADGTAVAAGSLVYTIPTATPGLVDVSLAPTEGSNPASKYTVTYSLVNGARYPETWTVPRLGGPKTISQVRGTA